MTSEIKSCCKCGRKCTELFDKFVLGTNDNWGWKARIIGNEYKYLCPECYKVPENRKLEQYQA